MSDCTDCNMDCTPPEIRALATNTHGILLPKKSKQVYEKKYCEFESWRTKNNISKISENVMLAYFEVQRHKYKSSSLWSLYSQLKLCIKINHNLDISTYHKVIALLKRCSEGYAPKKSKIFTEEEINKFINESEDKIYLAMKVILIMGYSGACRRDELIKMSTDDVEYKDTSILVTIPITKNNTSRAFVITEKIWITLIQKYAALRHNNTTHKRFFVTYRNGSCISNPIGINSIGKVCKEIAIFLGLPDPQLFTGHCFRRSSATNLVNRGGDLLTLKHHGGWKSSSVAEGYIDSTLNKRIEIAEMLKPKNLPSSSGISECTSHSISSTATATVPEIQHNIINNNDIPGLVINSSNSSRVTVNVYNNCNFK